MPGGVRNPPPPPPLHTPARLHAAENMYVSRMGCVFYFGFYILVGRALQTQTLGVNRMMMPELLLHFISITVCSKNKTPLAPSP